MEQTPEQIHRGQAASIDCPSCGAALAAEDDTAYCERCELHLAGIPTQGKRLAAYALSLPERLTRIAAGALGGMFKGALELILPDALRRTRLYHVLLNKNLRYLIREFGDVDGIYRGDAPRIQNYAARKFVGNFVELAGFLTMRASPVWILALLSDLSGGTKVFLHELAAEMKKEGLLEPDAAVDSIDQLLDGLQSMTGRLADQIDTPPLSLEDLRETLTYLRQDAQSMKLKDLAGEENVESMLEEMKQVAERERKSLYEISAAMAINAVNQLERSGRTAVTGARVGKALLDRTILRHYRQALRDISRAGYYRYLARSAQPYLRAMRRHLARKNFTWTERYFLSRTWGGGASDKGSV